MSAPRGEALVAVGVVHHAGKHPPPIAHRDAHAPLRYAEDEIDGPVERVHHPVQAAAARLGAAPLLPHEPIFRPPALEQLADRALGGDVGLADEVRRRALGHYLALGALAHPFDQQPARRARRLGGELEQRRRFAHTNSAGRRCAHGRAASI